MSPSPTEPVAWRRENGNDYVGALTLGEGHVRLVGRDPESSLEVSLSIPFAEIDAVRVGGDDVILELAGSQAICVRGLADRPALAERIRSAVDA